MIPTFNRSMPIWPLEPWTRALRILSLFTARAARVKMRTGAGEEVVAAAQLESHEAKVDWQRKYFTGNFFAGPAALIHPDLLKPEKKTKGKTAPSL